MRERHHFSRPRPPWWPENQPWPPARRMRHFPFFRRIGCFFLSFYLLSLVVAVGFIILVARALGLLQFQINAVQWLIPLGVVFALLTTVAFGLGGMGLRRVAGPLDDLLKAADRVGEGDYSIRVVEKGPRELRSMARAFNAMASRLDQLDERRRNLLADVTHELRTPLTVVQGNLEGMLDGVYPADQTNLRLVLDETHLLSRLVDDLRTLALAESGALKLTREPTDLAMLVNETTESFRAQASTAGVTLAVEVGQDLPWLAVDPARIRQVLTNLIANALRYTPAGGTVAVRYTLEDGYASLEVRDTGAGIPPDELPNIFERFYKSPDSKGMGLGLAIARRLVEAHGGTIRAESTLGHGSVLRVDIPISEE